MTKGEEAQRARALAWRDSVDGLRSREQTAATILAAIIPTRDGDTYHDDIATAVRLTDALRVALVQK